MGIGVSFGEGSQWGGKAKRRGCGSWGGKKYGERGVEERLLGKDFDVVENSGREQMVESGFKGLNSLGGGM